MSAASLTTVSSTIQRCEKSYFSGPASNHLIWQPNLLEKAFVERFAGERAKEFELQIALPGAAIQDTAIQYILNQNEPIRRQFNFISHIIYLASSSSRIDGSYMKRHIRREAGLRQFIFIVSSLALVCIQMANREPSSIASLSPQDRGRLPKERS